MPSVELWYLERCESVPSATARQVSLLDATERAHMGRLVHPADRDSYLYAHLLLRLVVARACDRPAAALCFRPGANGRPELVDGPGREELDFNLSHTRGGVAVALGRGTRVGVDMEAQARVIEVEPLLPILCSAAERRWLEALPVAHRRAAFMRLWVTKEAYLKGLGCGLGREPSSVECHADGEGRLCCRPVATRAPVGDGGGDWRVDLHTTPGGYLLALAHEGLANSVPHSAEGLLQGI